VSKYRLYRIDPATPQTAEMIDSQEREKQMVRAVFKRWPVASCMPAKHSDGSVVLTIWETADDAKQKKMPVALVRTFPQNDIGFKQQLWATPVSA
jgi:hypothetical protein